MRHLEKNTLDYTLFNVYTDKNLNSMTRKVFKTTEGEKILQCNTRSFFEKKGINIDERNELPMSIPFFPSNNCSYKTQLRNKEKCVPYIENISSLPLNRDSPENILFEYHFPQNSRNFQRKNVK